MLHHLSLILRMNIRKIRTTAPKTQPPQREGARFSQQELTRMGTYGRDTLNIGQAFKMKYKGGESAEEPQTRYEKKVKTQNPHKKYDNRSFFAYREKQQRTNPEEMTLKQLTSVRLNPQYLPVSYLKKVQKIFHKYDQNQLREIADNFSKLVRLRYVEQKLNYEQYQNLKFLRLEEKLPKDKQVEQIYLIGEQKVYEDKEREPASRKVDTDPFAPQISYTQNVAVSYLLNRVPRTYAVAFRIMTQIRHKFPQYKAKSFIDFGSGLSSGATAFTEVFGNMDEVYNVEPAGKMRKLSKYITQDYKFKYYQTLGQLSQTIKQVDIVYAGYVINELNPDLVQIYLQALYAKVRPQGFLILVEYGNPFGARLIHEARKWAIEKKMEIAAPCPHSGKCPLAKEKIWCHFDQPSGMYPSNVFGKLPTDQAVKLEKYSYLILQKTENEDEDMLVQKVEPNVTKQWDRVLFPTMKRGKHIVFNLCTKTGLFQRRVSAKSHKQEFKEAKKLRWGDFWRFGKRIPNKFRKERFSGRRLW